MKKRLPTEKELKELSDFISTEIPDDVVNDLMEDALFLVVENYAMTNDLVGIQGIPTQIMTFRKIMIALWPSGKEINYDIEIYVWVDGKITKHH